MKAAVRAYLRDNNINLHMELLIGVNPFANTNSFPFMREACDMLIKCRQYSWRTLRLQYESAFEWSSGESYPHIRIATDILEEQGVIEDRGPCFVLKPLIITTGDRVE